MAKKKIPELLVIFDTNVLFTKVASDLVRQSVRQIIDDNSNHPDLKLTWYLPKIVVNERRYQMIGKAKELLPNMHKLEKLIGNAFGINDDTLEMHVDNAIRKGIELNGFQIADIVVHDVDWESIISRSVTRMAPFEVGDKEKGFRDSIIAHTFFQLYQSSPTTPQSCRLALVSEDELLRDYVSELTENAKNVRILSSLDDLESLINTLISTVPEDLAPILAEKARKLFFEKGSNKGLYFKGNIGGKILEQYSEDLNKTLIPGTTKNILGWLVYNPMFIKKKGQRLYWVSTIEREFEIYHYESKVVPQAAFNPLVITNPPYSSTPGAIPISTGTGIETSTNTSTGFTTQFGLGTTSDPLEYFPPQEKIVDFKGKERFDVHWSSNLSQALNLTLPKLEIINYMGNDFSEDI